MSSDFDLQPSVEKDYTYISLVFEKGVTSFFCSKFNRRSLSNRKVECSRLNSRTICQLWRKRL